MDIAKAEVFWIETGAMQGEKRYILEIAEHLADFFEEKQGSATTVPIRHQGVVWKNQDFKHHSSDHYTPQWRLFLPTAFSEFSQDYYRHKVAKFEKETANTQWFQGECYNLKLRKPSHVEVEDWKDKAEAKGEKGRTGQGNQGREYGYY